MSFQHAVGQLSLRSGIGTQAITGVGFQPKVVFFFSATTGGAADDFCIFLMGFDDGVTAYGHAIETAQGATPPQESTSASLIGSSILRVSSLGLIFTIILQAHIASMDADGFTLLVTQNNLSQNERIEYVAFGGSDLEYELFELFPGAAATQVVNGLSLAPHALIAFRLGGTSGLGVGWCSVSQGRIGLCDQSRWACR